MALNAEDEKRPWILLKMARPLAQGPLWEHLHQNFSDRLIVVATVDDLRLSEVQISRELSWERTAQDIFWELIHNPCVNSLSHCAHVVISFGTAGAILLSRQEEKESAHLPMFPVFRSESHRADVGEGLSGRNDRLQHLPSRRLGAPMDDLADSA